MIRFVFIVALLACTILPNAPTVFAANTHVKASGPLHISFGKEVTLADYLVTGKITVFDFYSDYCPPCRAMKPYLETLHEKRDEIAVVIVKINRPGVQAIDWDSPVAQEFRIK